MPCYHPRQVWRRLQPNKNGKHPLIFNFSHEKATPFSEMFVRCGRCIGCRLDKSREWATRCVHEASMHERNSFLTLTYSPEFLPENGSLVKSDLQGFWKRLRRRVEPLELRYYQCGEYGDKFKRPHYHAICFGFDFPDKELFQVRNGFRLYRSHLLDSVWPFGFTCVADVTFESCAYVARYVTKKIYGDLAEEHYGERIPEFQTQSTKRGIGRDWIEKFLYDVYPLDKVVIRDGVTCKPPRYYDQVCELLDPDLWDQVYRERLKNAIAFSKSEESSLKRQIVKEQIKISQFDKLIRPFEDEVF